MESCFNNEIVYFGLCQKVGDDFIEASGKGYKRIPFVLSEGTCDMTEFCLTNTITISFGESIKEWGIVDHLAIFKIDEGEFATVVSFNYPRLIEEKITLRLNKGELIIPLGHMLDWEKFAKKIK